LTANIRRLRGVAVSSRLHNLQALRGVACLLVLFCHLAGWERLISIYTPHRLLSPMHYCGFAGVDLFFVLSGFVITWVSVDGLGDRTRLAGYLGRRLWRIYPTYWACWGLAATAGFILVSRPWPTDGSVLTRVLLLLPSDELNPVIPQAWTLCYEVAFYLAFAVFFVLPRRAFLPLLALWAVAVVTALIVSMTGPTWTPPLLLRFHVMEFLLGCFAAAAVRRGRVAWGRSALAVGIVGFAAGGVATYTGLTYAHPANRALIFCGPSALIVYGAAAVEAARGWVLPRWLRAVGDASYSIYLTHLVALEWTSIPVRWLTQNWRGHLHVLIGMTVCSIAVGFLVHYSVERPLIMLGRRRRPGRDAGIAVPTEHARAA
jgi:exopolysaccharide production protein ExoZ